MAYEQTRLLELVERAVNHRWSIPEFQRGFVWKPTQVRDLAESLWLDYPIGSLLVWNSVTRLRSALPSMRNGPASGWSMANSEQPRCVCFLAESPTGGL